MERIWNAGVTQYIRQCVRMYFEKQVPTSSAGLAYFLMLTSFPLIVCVNAFLGLLQLESTKIIEYLERFIPEVSQEIIETYLSYISSNESRGLLMAGVLMVLTTASAAFRAMIKIMARIYEMPHAKGWKHMLISVIFPIALLVTIYLSIGVILTGDWILNWANERFPIHLFFDLWNNVRFLLLFMVFFLFILLISYLSVPREAPKLPIILGSAISSLALMGASVGFSHLITFSTRYSLVYGSLFSIVAMLVWLYICSNILLFGNILSSVWYKEYGTNRIEKTKGQ